MPVRGRSRGLLRVMAPYLRQVAGLLTLGSLSGVVMNIAVVLPAVLLGRAVDVALSVQRGQASAADLTRAALLYVAGTLATEVPRVGKRWWLGLARARIRATVRADALRGVLSWPPESLHAVAVGDVVARVIGDVEVLGTGIGEIIVETWDTLLFSTSLIVAMLAYSPSLTVWALLPVPVALLLAKYSGRWVAARTLTARRANAALTVYIGEQLAGLRVLRAFGRTGTATARLSRLAGAQADAELSTTALNARLQPTYAVTVAAGVIAVVWMGGDRVAGGALSVGALVAFLQLFLRFSARAHRIPQMANRVQAARVAHARLASLLAPAAPGPRWSSWRAGAITAPRAVPPPADATNGSPSRVLLERVDFTYPDGAGPALRQLSLTIEPGSTVAVTGPVGSGKSALAAVLAGLYPITGGQLLVDGHDPARWTVAQRSHVGYLPQNDHLFTGTVRDNITMSAVDIDDQRVSAAIRIAGLAGDLRDWPDGEHTQIGERGVRVSGGQRQRISLARALAAPRRPPRLLVLDDPFSAVDVATEAAIISALREAVGSTAPEGQRATVVLCSTRLAAFPAADHVVVLDRGTVAEQGRHDQLLAAGGVYARMFRAQQRTRDRPEAIRP
jgi:ABC-type multidrug transport system fused ATPase/permease subunit